MSHLRRLKVSEVMTEHVVTARPNDSLPRVAVLMEGHKIGSVVITENRKIVGILTERDFARIVKQGILLGRDRAKHHMTKPVIVVRSNSSLEDLVKQMRRKHVRHVPVVDRKRKLVGIISSRDLIDTALDFIK